MKDDKLKEYNLLTSLNHDEAPDGLIKIGDEFFEDMEKGIIQSIVMGIQKCNDGRFVVGFFVKNCGFREAEIEHFLKYKTLFKRDGKSVINLDDYLNPRFENGKTNE